MDILYVVSKFPKLSESFVINELYELDDRNHNVSVFSINRPDEKVTHEEVDEMDIPTYYADQPSFKSVFDLLSQRVLNPTLLQRSTFIDNPIYHAFNLHLAKQISEVIDEVGGVDLIHTHFATPDRLAVSHAAAYHEVPCTVTAHASEVFSPPSLQRLKRICSRFNHIILPSEYNKRYLRTELGVETPMSVVPATTNVEKFKPSKNCVSRRLLTVARLVEKKGHEYAIDAVSQLVHQGYDIEYHIIGSGEREEFLRDLVRKLEIEDHVTFLNNVSDEKLMNELHEAEVFLLPCVVTAEGDRDITPVALREAMATQTACVSTRISAIPEVITDGHDGILVEPRDSEALVDAIADLFENQSWRAELSRNARETIETKFDIRIAVDQLEEIFASQSK
ncbi:MULTISPECIES: glycosyltransferase [unclassified Haloferax]|uniref:glycosyltransferase n=1 Tax=unclassified Haloferax TaxID=2625095 RepID=UPI001EF9E5C4|nr:MULTISPECIES: glycosyltransferase [unclassified Haloferax]